jgi:hypothetical protein
MEANSILIAVVVTGGFSLALGIWHSRRQARQRQRLLTLQRLEEICSASRMRQNHGPAAVERGPR